MVIVDDGSLKCKITDKILKANVSGLIIRLKLNSGHNSNSLVLNIFQIL